MDINTYRVIVIPTAEREINRIYEYILKDLELDETAKNLMKRIEEIINTLKYAPHIFTKVERNYGLDMKYRRIVVKNYVILYTIDEKKQIVYIAHMYYKKRNYLN